MHVQEQVEQELKSLEANTERTLTYDDVQNMLWDVETFLELEWDPIAQIAAEYSHKCFEKGIIGYSMEYTGDPELPEIKGLWDIEGLQKRIEAMKERLIKERLLIDKHRPICNDEWISHIV